METEKKQDEEKAFPYLIRVCNVFVFRRSQRNFQIINHHQIIQTPSKANNTECGRESVDGGVLKTNISKQSNLLLFYLFLSPSSTPRLPSLLIFQLNQEISRLF